MIEALKWILVIEGVGWVFFPFTQKLFPKFRDKGYSASKIIGLLVIGYLFWLGNSFQLIPNSGSGVYLTLFLVLTAAVIFFFKNDHKSIINWVKENLNIIIFVDILFLVTFLGWSLVRAGNPEIIGTEKPMELALINGIYRSPSFPPHDPWLSGYSISYYYFGYLLVSIFMQLLGTVSGTAFNLAVALFFSLTAVMSAGILFNVISSTRSEVEGKEKTRSIFLASLLAPLLILIVSNAEGLLEMMHSAGLFWRMDDSGALVSDFWIWLDIQELVHPPSPPFDLIPSRAGGTWWWRASRVLQDYTAAGTSREIIDEFPFFSYLLADLHPHVISMPFVLLVVLLGLDIFLNPPKIEWGLKSSFYFWTQRKGLWIAFFSGGLIFINTWDFPIYFALIVGYFMVGRIRKNGWGKERIREIFLIFIPYGILSVAFFLPFLIGLSSQAGGFLPSLVYKTGFVHFLVMFFPHVLIVTPMLFVMLFNKGNLKGFRKTFLITLFLVLFLFAASMIVPLLINSRPIFLQGLSDLIGLDLTPQVEKSRIALESFLGIYESQNAGELFNTTARRLLSASFLLLFLILWASISLTIIFKIEYQDDLVEENEKRSFGMMKSDRFILTLVFLAALLILAPEIFYLRDQFGWRMNTIFKFYFQAWMLLSISSAYFLFRIQNLRSVITRLLSTSLALMGLIAGLVYPVFTLLDKTNRFQNIVWSLNGNRYFEETNPEEFEAVEFLNHSDFGIVSEAVGGSYSSYARVSKLTGLPTVLGWPGHEVQWRGGGEEIGSRENDIRDLYSTVNWERAEEILETYNIRYVYIGSLERSSYSVSDIKFRENMPLIFDNGVVLIYEFVNNG